MSDLARSSRPRRLYRHLAGWLNMGRPEEAAFVRMTLYLPLTAPAGRGRAPPLSGPRAGRAARPATCGLLRPAARTGPRPPAAWPRAAGRGRGRREGSAAAG